MAKTDVETPPATREPPKDTTKKTRPPFTRKNPDGTEKTPKILTFFQQVARIAKEDWGTRASIKLYRLEPVINRLVTSDNKYIGVYAEPVDEERIKVDYGSGKYRLYLNYKLPATAEGKELDSVEFDILDEKYPPKIPAGEWVDDPKNKKWAWARAAVMAQFPATAPPPTAAHDLVDTMRAVNEIQTSAVERERASQVDPFAMIKAVKDLMPAPVAPASENGMFTAIVTMMTENAKSQAAILTAQIAAAQADNKELRQELRDMRNTKQGGGWKEILTEVKEFLPSIKELFPPESRSRQPWWTGVVEQLVSGPVLPMLADKILAGQQQNGAPPPNGQPRVNGAAQTNIINFLQQIGPAVVRYVSNEADGGMLADSLYDVHGTSIAGIPWIEAKSRAGVDGLFNLFKQSPFWPVLQSQEPQFRTFLTQFVNWKPDMEDGTDTETIDAETEPAVEVL